VFYRRHVDGLLRFFGRALGRADLAFDLTAETFASVLSELPRFQPTGAPATAWLYTIARNRLIDSMRRSEVEARARRRLAMGSIELTDNGEAVIEGIIARAAADPALTLVDSLPPAQREAVLARVIDGREYTEIANELRCSEQVIRKRVSRGLETLRRGLEAQP
jgi:RNA polymerase sigma factor (sigma-70 family)